MILILLLLEVVASRVSGKLYSRIHRPTNTFVAAGDDVLLNCSVMNGVSADNITWSAVKHLGSKKVIRTKESSNWLSLLLTNVTLHDAGTYSCVVEKGGESDKDTYKLVVNAKPEIKLRRFLVLKPNIRQNIKCAAVGWPMPNIQWYYDETTSVIGQILSSSVYELRNNQYPDEKKRESTLEIIGTEKGLNDGSYTCQATNKNGRKRRTVLVLIAEKPEMEANRDQIVLEGVDVILTCEVKKVLKHDTQVVADWKFQGKPINLTNTSRSRVRNNRTSNSMSLELLVSNVSMNDSGQYKCSVTSTGGSASGTVRINVVSKDIHPKVEIQGKQMITRSQGSSVVLLCHVSYPLYMKTMRGFWLNETKGRRVNRLQTTTRPFHISTEELSLNIVNVTNQDEGIYVCVLNTTKGKYSAQVQLIITRPGGNNDEEYHAQEGRSTSSLIAAVIVISGGVLLVIVGLVFVHRRKRRFKYGYGNHGPTNNMEFKYDAFLTFSGKDFEWVKKKLMPLLEEYSVKYCIHQRDFELGKGIYDNMAESVYTSKKVLAIVSKNYMTSKFCQSELEMALYRNTEMGDSSLIVIRIDGIDKESLPKSLRNRTFLDYHDKTERKTWEERLIKHIIKNNTV